MTPIDDLTLRIHERLEEIRDQCPWSKVPLIVSTIRKLDVAVDEWKLAWGYIGDVSLDIDEKNSGISIGVKPEDQGLLEKDFDTYPYLLKTDRFFQ